MKFDKLKKELNEIDYSSLGQQKRVSGILGGIDGSPESVRITIMKKMGATTEEISRWHAARKRGTSFEAYLIGLVQELKDRPAPEEDFDRAVMGRRRDDSSFEIE